jgi:hypothetical protein
MFWSFKEKEGGGEREHGRLKGTSGPDGGYKYNAWMDQWDDSGRFQEREESRPEQQVIEDQHEGAAVGGSCGGTSCWNTLWKWKRDTEGSGGAVQSLSDWSTFVRC